MHFFAAHPNDSIRVWLCFHYVETFFGPSWIPSLLWPRRIFVVFHV